MFEQYGSDSLKPSVNLNALLPSVNQSEVSHSFLSTLFQRWLTKPDTVPVMGKIGFSNPIAPNAIIEPTPGRQAFQLTPVAVVTQGNELVVNEWADILRKAQFTGVDPLLYGDWGQSLRTRFAPPIDFDKLLNWTDYYWVNVEDINEQPDYITIAVGEGNDWSESNKWVKKTLLTPSTWPYAKQATLPIVEFVSGLELSVTPVVQQKTPSNPHPRFNLYTAKGEIWGEGRLWEYSTELDDPILYQTNQRVVTSNAFEDVEFRTDVVSPTGELLFYKRNGVLQTVWNNFVGGELIDVYYKPQYVNALREPITNADGSPNVTGSGAWEPNTGLTTNPANEMRTVMRLSEILPHVTDTLSDPSAGTMYINEPAVQRFITSLLVPNLSIPALLRYATAEREYQLGEIRTDFVTELVNTIGSPTYDPNVSISAQVYDRIKANALIIKPHNQAYEHSISYNPATGAGFPNIMPTLSMLGLVASAPPKFERDDEGRIVLYLHDTATATRTTVPVHLTPIQQRDIVQGIERRVPGILTSTTPPIPSTRRMLWKHPSSGKLSVFVVQFYAPVAPIQSTDGELWFNTTTNTLLESVSNEWITVDIQRGWVQLDIEQLLAEVLLEYEGDLYARVVGLNPPQFDREAILLSPSDAAEYDRQIEDRYTATLAETNTLDTPVIRSVWESTVDFTVVELEALYSTQPIRFFREVIRPFVDSDILATTGLHINKATNNTFNQRDIREETLTSIDTLVRYWTKRQQSSALTAQPVLTSSSWETKLAYLTSTLVDVDTFVSYDQCEVITDYKIVLKKTENVKVVEFSNLLVGLRTPGSSGTLPKGRGEDWEFEITCSQPFLTKRQKYGVLKQRAAWSATSNSFDVGDSNRIKWQTGGVVTLVAPYGEISTTTSLYVRVLTSRYFQLFQSPEEAESGTNPISFGDVDIESIELQTVENTFTVTHARGKQDWIAPAVDYQDIQVFDFPVIVQGVQGIVDFVEGYVQFLNDDGLRFNIGEEAILDVETGATITWRQQLIQAIKSIYESNGLSNRRFAPVGEYTDRVDVASPRYLEMNPFKNAIWVFTPDGVIGDMLNTPYVNETLSVASLYTNKGTPIVHYFTPLRSDRITSIFYTPPIDPNQQLNSTDYLAGGRLSIDFYEHCVLFDEQRASGLVLYDRFFNLQKPSINLEFKKSIHHFYRPTMGGFAVGRNETFPNLETVATRQRNDYSITLSDEQVPSTLAVRESMGYQEQKYFDNLPASSKTKFQFWKNMIREKGTTDAVKAFSRHTLVDKSDIDEYWAWYENSYGAAVARDMYEIALTQDDNRAQTSVFWLGTSPLPFKSQFPITVITEFDDDRWINYPGYLQQKENLPVTHRSTVNGTHTFVVDPTTGVTTVPTGPYKHNLLSQDYVVVATHYPTSEVISFVETSSTGEILFPANLLNIGVAQITAPSTKWAVVANGNSQQVNWVVADDRIIIENLPAGASVRVYCFPKPPLSKEPLSGGGPRSVDVYDFTGVSLPPPASSTIVLVTLEGVIPNYSTHTPLRILDRASGRVEIDLPAWDPRKGIHSKGIRDIDVIAPTSPAIHGTSVAREDPSGLWGAQQLGTYWLDSKSLRYKPYDDHTRYTFDEMTARWGALYDEKRPVVYEWVSSRERPGVRTEEGTPYTRTFRKARGWISIAVPAAFPATTLTATSGFDPLASATSVASVLNSLNGERVAIYSDGDLTGGSITGPSIQTEYTLVYTSGTSFELWGFVGTAYQQIPVTGMKGHLFVAAVDWEKYPYEEVVNLTETYLVSSTAVGVNFPIPSRITRVISDVTSGATVWVNGQLAAFGINGATNTFQILNPDLQTPMSLSLYDEVVIEYSQPEGNTVGDPDIDTPFKTVYLKDFPYTTRTIHNGDETVEEYFYWVSGRQGTKPLEKRHPVATVQRLIQYPEDGQYYFAVGYDKTSDTYGGLCISGLYEYPSLPNKALAFDVDPNLRTTLVTNQKNVHEQWKLFRERQEMPLPASLIARVKASVVGLNEYGEMVPSSVRIAYDFAKGTSTQYGSDPSQVLLDKFESRKYLLEFFGDVEETGAPSLSNYILNQLPQTPNEWSVLFELCMKEFTVPVVNRFILNVLKQGLAHGFQYDRLLKTSYISIQVTQQGVRGN